MSSRMKTDLVCDALKMALQPEHGAKRTYQHQTNLHFAYLSQYSSFKNGLISKYQGEIMCESESINAAITLPHTSRVCR